LKAKECRDCGEEIESGRAKALPYVETCVHCQKKREAEGRYRKHMMKSQVTYAVGGEIETIEDSIVRG
jgi:hypothetical protein